MKNTCFLAYFFAKIFHCKTLTVFFMVLGAQSKVVIVSYGQGMVLSFKTSHEEALLDTLQTKSTSEEAWPQIKLKRGGWHSLP